ncbi:hypothetical protein MHB40_17975 [Lysinibacillus sp. FSL K6-0057]|uniref:hypothetical protein n=1 Tax=Lysinibacillus sp. FSL K6-0057 TaxID=2921411 RepID=UPI00315A0AA4
MITIQKKEEVAKQYSDILKIIYHLGKGIMWRTQLKQYLQQFFAISEKEFILALKDLTDADIIHIHRYCNRHIIRLKKFAIYYLTCKERASVASITFTTSKAIKSAYINAVLLYNLMQLEVVESLDLYIEEIAKRTTLLAKDKSNHHILTKLLSIQSYKHSWEKIRFEIEELERIRLTNIQKLQNVKAIEKPLYYYNFNLNAMQARDIYLGGWVIENKVESRVSFHGPIIYIFNINQKYNYIPKLEENLKQIREYFSYLLDTPQGFTIQFKLIVEDMQLENKLRNNQKYKNFVENLVLDEIEILNLNILNDVFGGVHLLK